MHEIDSLLTFVLLYVINDFWWSRFEGIARTIGVELLVRLDGTMKASTVYLALKFDFFQKNLHYYWSRTLLYRIEEKLCCMRSFPVFVPLVSNKRWQDLYIQILLEFFEVVLIMGVGQCMKQLHVAYSYVHIQHIEIFIKEKK